MTNYLSAISYGKFQIHNVFPQDTKNGIQSYELPYTMDQVYNGNIDYSMIQKLVADIPALKDAGDSMTVNVTIPEASQFDIWKEMEFTSQEDENDFYRNVDMVQHNGIPYVVTCENQNIQMFKNAKDGWKKVGKSFSAQYSNTLKLLFQDEFGTGYPKKDVERKKKRVNLI